MLKTSCLCFESANLKEEREGRLWGPGLGWMSPESRIRMEKMVECCSGRLKHEVRKDSTGMEDKCLHCDIAWARWDGVGGS